MYTRLQQLLMEVECSHVRKKTRQISLVLEVIFTQFELDKSLKHVVALSQIS
jgi:hypothetical protein